MGKASRDKGARGERELVNALKDAGLVAIRTASLQASRYQGRDKAGDVLVECDAGDVRIEVKSRADIAKKWDVLEPTIVRDAKVPDYLWGWMAETGVAVIRRCRAGHKSRWVWCVMTGPLRQLPTLPDDLCVGIPQDDPRMAVEILPWAVGLERLRAHANGGE